MNRLQAAEKRYANLKYLWQQAEKEVATLKVQNADLVVALEELLAMAKYYKPFSGEYPPPVDEDEETWAIGQVYYQAEQALGKVKGDQS